MLKIGLTGGIGSGKSTLSNMFLVNGIKVIDADKIARKILDKYPKTQDEIKSKLGTSFFDASGLLNRRELGNYIFKNPEKRLVLEGILMPLIIQDIFNEFNKLELMGEKMAILDAPVLIEQGFHKYMDINILVWTERKVQIERLTKRNAFTLEEAENRINSQMSLDSKKEYVNIVIDNNGTIEITEKQFWVVYNELIKMEPSHE